MSLKSERETMQALITNALTELCKNHLRFKSSVSLEALVGITLDENDVLLVSVKETVPLNDQRVTPKKSPMQVALKSVEKAVQKINEKSGVKSPSRLSPRKKTPPALRVQNPAVINIMPTNLEPIGTVDVGPSFAFINTTVDVKEEEESDDAYGVSPGTLSSLAAITVGQKDDEARTPTTLKRKLPVEHSKKQKSLRFSQQISQDDDERRPMPLDVKYLGLSREDVDDKDFKRGKYLERLCQGSIIWNDLSADHHNCVYAKCALRGSRENDIVCSLCASPFSKVDDFKKHIKAHFGYIEMSGNVVQISSVPEEPSGAQSQELGNENFCCPLCNENFTSKRSLIQHIRDGHKLFCKDLMSIPESSGEKEHSKSTAERDTTKATTQKNSAVHTPTTEVRTSARIKAHGGKTKQLEAKSPTKSTLKGQAPNSSLSATSKPKSQPEGGPVNTMEVTVVPQLLK